MTNKKPNEISLLVEQFSNAILHLNRDEILTLSSHPEAQPFFKYYEHCYSEESDSKRSHCLRRAVFERQCKVEVDGIKRCDQIKATNPKLYREWQCDKLADRFLRKLVDAQTIIIGALYEYN